MNRPAHPSAALLAVLLLCLGPWAAGCTADGDASAAAAPAAVRAAPSATVLQTMDSGGYTYVEIEVDGVATWFAGPTTALAKGDRIAVPSRQMPMRDFQSATLGRSFALIYFVDGFRKVASADAAALSPEADAAHAAHAVRQAHADQASGGPAAPVVEFDGLVRPDGGLTVAEVFARGKEAAGSEVLLRGKVVKYNGGILGKNWLHVRDGSGAEGTNDITVTTDATAAVGDTVLIRGKLAADRDLGFGYVFALLIEDAAVTVER